MTFPASSNSLEHPEMSGNPRYSGNNFFSFIKTPRPSTRKAASDTNGSETCFSPVIHATGFRSTTRMSISLGNLRTTSTSSRSEEHTSELQSHSDLVCSLLLEKQKTQTRQY